LTKIYTKSIETGTIPKDWKHANVAPAFKKGERYKAKMPESSLEYGFVFRNISVCIIIYGGKLYRML
jgi:hypothetical protein